MAIKPDRTYGPLPAPQPEAAPDDSKFEVVTSALNRARRPIGVIGLALDPVRDTVAVRRFFAQTDIPYAVLPQGKGVADESGYLLLESVFT